MHIPFVDLTGNESQLETKILKHIRNVALSQQFILGKDVAMFESEFASYIGVKYCIGVASGTDTLLLGLLALGIGPGDEVIAPAVTFISSVTPVIQLGAKLVLVDIQKDIPLIDPAEVEKAVTKRTKAIIAVHLHGHPCDMNAIMNIARKNKLLVIEDACQAHGAEIRVQRKTEKGKRKKEITNNNNKQMWKKAGSIGDIGCFSFYPSKNLGCWGDGGAITTNRADIAEKVALLRSHGQKKKNYHILIGYTSRLDTIQAAVLREKLPFLDTWNERRTVLAGHYRSLLGHTPVLIPVVLEGRRTNYHVYQIQTGKRDALLSYMLKHGVQCNMHYPLPLHRQPAFSHLPGMKTYLFPHASHFTHTTLSVPMYPGLSDTGVTYVSGLIEKFFQTKTS